MAALKFYKEIEKVQKKPNKMCYSILTSTNRVAPTAAKETLANKNTAETEEKKAGQHN